MEHIGSEEIVPGHRDKIGLTRQVELVKDDIVLKTHQVTEEVTRKAQQVSIDAQAELRRDPVKWAGIAAAAGLALGLFGRYLRYRAKVKKQPLIVIEETN